MKKTTRILSLLLALVMLAGILPVMTFAAATKEKDLGDLPDTAQDVVYLSDLVYVESTNLDNAEAIRDGAWKTGTITLGSSNTSFTKGLGVMPQSPDGNGSYGKSWTTFDVSGLKSNNFYATVGITNGYGKILTNGQSTTVTNADGSTTTHKVIGTGLVFEVWATYEDNGEFVLLESSETIIMKETYEFHVNITGVKLLQLVVRCNEDIAGYHGYMNCAWGAACVYKDDYTPNTTIYGDSNGVAVIPESANVHNTYDTVPSSGVTYLNADNALTVEDYDDSLATSGVKIGGLATSTSDNSNAVTFAKGKVVRLTARAASNTDADNNVDGYAIYNVSGLGNTFYAAVGITNTTGRYSDYNSSNGNYGGVIFEVYGSADIDYETAEFTLLAQSEVIYKCNTGEFNVDITGMNLVKLLVRANAGSHASTDSVFGNACVYNADKFDISYANMGLTNDLSVKFAFKQNSAAFTEDHYAEIVFRGTKKIVKFADWKTESIDGEAYYSVGYSGVAAKEMTDTFGVTIYDGDGNPVSNTFTDTVQDYCLRRLMQKTYESDPTDAKNNVDALLCRVIVDVLNYGAAAQAHFVYNENDLANDVLIAKLAALGGAEPEAAATPAATKTGDLYVATNVALESNIRMAFGFSGLTDGMTARITFTHHNATAATTVNVTSDEFTTREDFDGQVIILDELVVADCRQDVTVTIYDESDKVLATVTDSVARYLARKAASEDSDVFDALLTVSDSAYAYFYAYDNPKEQQSGTLNSHQVLATDITNGRIIVADLDKTNPFATTNLIWTYTDTNLAAYLSDAKVRMLGSTKVVLYTASNGQVGMIDYSTKKVLWEYNLDDYYTDLVDASGNKTKSNPHAIELLPNGDIVVASSGGSSVWENGRLTYFDMNGTTCNSSRMTSFELYSAHGVAWDPENDLLWVSGFQNIEAYKLTSSGSYATITKVSGKGAAIPGGYGHDLMQDYSDLDILWITDGANVYQFSKSKNKILSEYSGSNDLLNVAVVKGIGSFSDGVIALAAGGASKTIKTYWPLNDGSYELVEYTDASYGFNKVRVFTTDYQ